MMDIAEIRVPDAPPPMLSVSDLNRCVRDILEHAWMPFWLSGEVGDCRSSGQHVYLTLKDTHCQIRATWWNAVRRVHDLGIRQGSQIEAFGNISVYEAGGQYQFNISQARLAGKGDKQREFEEIRNRLDREGLFSDARKRPIPMFPRTVGVVTSPTGAAIRDFIRTLMSRNPLVEVRVYPSQVQGENAAEQLVAGVEFFAKSYPVDVIVVTRGGGSLEDLWAFNDERLARTIAASPIPVISAVGHERDTSISDMVADLRASTPTQAAELICIERSTLVDRLDSLTNRLSNSLQLRHNALATRFERAIGALSGAPTGGISNLRSRLDRLEGDMRTACVRQIQQEHQHLDMLSFGLADAAKNAAGRFARHLERLTATLDALNPQRQLERGYALVRDEAGNIIRDGGAVSSGQRVEIRVAKGEISAVVTAGRG
ncbi:MAG: exodeoxyribonuclease VII large subunit [Victivallaceae bacterium]|nr:exodeoxyribonuclease VII large subunit [Victivallaceae bacterium]